MISKIASCTTIVTAVGALFFAFELDYLHFLWLVDKTHLSFLIMLLGAIGICVHVYLAFHGKALNYITYTRLQEFGFELADLATGIGMLGTVLGFIMMSFSLAGANLSSLQNIKHLIALTTSGMSTALITTAAGLIVSLILRILFFLLDQEQDG